MAIVRTQSLQFGYSTGTLFTFPDIMVDRGQHILLIGNSGCGKTTFIHLLGGLLKSHTGGVHINGINISSFNEGDLDRFRSKHIGFIFQNNHLIRALSVRENLLMPSYLAGCKQAVPGVDEIAERLGISDMLNRNVRTLSYGQAQRAAIARAAINRPLLILADEPTSALDDENCERVMSLLLGVAQCYGSTLIIATHDHRLKSMIPTQINLSR